MFKWPLCSESHPKAKTNNVDNTVCQRETVECFLYVKKWFNKKGEKSYIEIGKISAQNEFTICDIVEEEKETCANFTVGFKPGSYNHSM